MKVAPLSTNISRSSKQIELVFLLYEIGLLNLTTQNLPSYPQELVSVAAIVLLSLASLNLIGVPTRSPCSNVEQHRFDVIAKLLPIIVAVHPFNSN